MNEEAFNLSIRKLLKHFGVTAQRDVEKAVDAAIRSGQLTGTETLRARATLEVEGLDTRIAVDGSIVLGDG